MRTLGFETSCDESAVAVLGPEGEVEAHLLASQVAAHAPYGGVVPELASREHLQALPWLTRQALLRAEQPIELVAVTSGPGLVGALLVGIRFAAAFAWGRRLPLVAVDHLDGHLVSPWVRLDGGPAEELPERALALVASGGHSSWYLLEHGRSRRLSRTRDDAAGEAFDKVAKAIGLPYPGGPVVDRLARTGDARAVALPRPLIKDGSLDVSFSGLKSAAIREVQRRRLAATREEAADSAVRDLLASFEAAVVDQLLRPLTELVATHRPQVVTASGGVAANTRLRSTLATRGHELGVDVLLPSHDLTTDNAVMIARAGQLRHARGHLDDPLRLDAHLRQVWQPPGMRTGMRT
jgi:N6-L-threonylcarbamoyladenine synthase